MDDIDTSVDSDDGIIQELTVFAHKVGVYVVFVAVLYALAKLLQSQCVFYNLLLYIHRCHVI